MPRNRIDPGRSDIDDRIAHEAAAVGELPRLDVEVLDDGLVLHPSSQMLYRKASISDHPVAEYLTTDGVVRLALPSAGQPRTIAQWQAARDQQIRVLAEQAERRRRRLVDGRRSVTLAWVENRKLPTLAEAHRTLLAEEALVEIVDGRLNIALSPMAGAIDAFGGSMVLPLSETRLRDACLVLFAAEHVVVAALAAGQPLPDVEITPNGRPIP